MKHKKRFHQLVGTSCAVVLTTLSMGLGSTTASAAEPDEQLEKAIGLFTSGAFPNYVDFKVTSDCTDNVRFRAWGSDTWQESITVAVNTQDLVSVGKLNPQEACTLKVTAESEVGTPSPSECTIDFPAPAAPEQERYFWWLGGCDTQVNLPGSKSIQAERMLTLYSPDVSPETSTTFTVTSDCADNVRFRGVGDTEWKSSWTTEWSIDTIYIGKEDASADCTLTVVTNSGDDTTTPASCTIDFPGVDLATEYPDYPEPVWLEELPSCLDDGMGTGDDDGTNVDTGDGNPGDGNEDGDLEVPWEFID